MRHAALLALVACSSPAPTAHDAAVTPDGDVAIDATPDASPDAPVDASTDPCPAPTVWNADFSVDPLTLGTWVSPNGTGLPGTLASGIWRVRDNMVRPLQTTPENTFGGRTRVELRMQNSELASDPVGTGAIFEIATQSASTLKTGFLVLVRRTSATSQMAQLVLREQGGVRIVETVMGLPADFVDVTIDIDVATTTLTYDLAGEVGTTAFTPGTTSLLPGIAALYSRTSEIEVDRIRVVTCAP